jgi:hypothetical protein
MKLLARADGSSRLLGGPEHDENAREVLDHDVRARLDGDIISQDNTPLIALEPHSQRYKCSYKSTEAEKIETFHHKDSQSHKQKHYTNFTVTQQDGKPNADHYST